MQALKLADDPATAKLITLKIKSLLDEAERIKTTGFWTLPAHPTSSETNKHLTDVDISKLKKLNEPVSTRKLTTAEEILLLKASKLNGFKFPPWKGPPLDADFVLKDDQVRFR